MPVIALTQGMGSLAQDIAEGLAQDLGLRTLQHELAERVADRMHISRSLVSRVRAGKVGLIEGMRVDKEALAVYTAEEVLATAAQGDVVIRGWGATQLLRAVPHVPCIRVMRPLQQRVQWLMQELGTDDSDLAESEIRRSDQSNASRMHDQFGVQWGDPSLFDMVLNVERLSVRTCIEQIKGLLQRPEFAETEASRRALQGLALAARVRAAMNSEPSTQAVNLAMEAVDGHVSLAGIVADAQEKSAAVRVAATVPGVTSVLADKLYTMADARRFPTHRR